jgi:hypothetical protein
MVGCLRLISQSRTMTYQVHDGDMLGVFVGVICLCVIDRYLNTIKVSFIQPYLLQRPKFHTPKQSVVSLILISRPSQTAPNH